MRIWLVCPVYPPEVLPAGVMLSQLAKHLAAAGHDVTVATTFPSLPQGSVFPGFRRRLFRRFLQDGVRVLRCFSFVYGEQRSPVWRILSHVSFALTASLSLILGEKPDVVVIEVFPVISSPILLLTARLRGILAVNYVQDLYPEAAEAAGTIKPRGLIANMCRSIDSLTCRHSRVNIVVSEQFRDAIVQSRKTDDDSIELIHNWIDGTKMTVPQEPKAWRAEHDIPAERFVAMFAGTMGIVSGVEFLTEVARELRERQQSEILLVCIGEGVAKAGMIDQARRLGLTNIMFLPFQPEESIAAAQHSSDVTLLTVREGLEASSIPSKLVTYLAVGRPVIASIADGSVLARLIREADCGEIVPPGNHIALADHLIRMSRDRDKLAIQAANARACFERHFELQIAMAKFDRLFSKLVRSAV